MPSSDLSITKKELEHAKDMLKSITHDKFVALKKDLEDVNVEILKTQLQEKYERRDQ